MTKKETTTIPKNNHQDYGAKAIKVLEGLEAVRKRPAMYIGGTDKTGLHHLVWEILDNSIDEVMNDYATTITVELDKSRDGIRITDNGRGIIFSLKNCIAFFRPMISLSRLSGVN